MSVLIKLRCRQAKTAKKSYKLSDARGLHLFVTAAGLRSWRSKYRVAGKEMLLVLGSYPEVSFGACARASGRCVMPSEGRDRSERRPQANRCRPAYRACNDVRGSSAGMARSAGAEQAGHACGRRVERHRAGCLSEYRLHAGRSGDLAHGVATGAGIEERPSVPAATHRDRPEVGRPSARWVCASGATARGNAPLGVAAQGAVV